MHYIITGVFEMSSMVYIVLGRLVLLLLVVLWVVHNYFLALR